MIRNPTKPSDIGRRISDSVFDAVIDGDTWRELLTILQAITTDTKLIEAARERFVLAGGRMEVCR